jgi:hypothetical protein
LTFCRSGEARRFDAYSPKRTETLLGVIARSPGRGPGPFPSNAFVSPAPLPDGLRVVAEWNTVSAVMAAVRSLFGNPTAAPAAAA